jgi:hypothetical protein
MADITSVQQQSRKSFFQWHVLLILKMKTLDKTLADAGYRPEVVREIDESIPPVVDSDELALLQKQGLPVPDDLTSYDLPSREQVSGIQFFFRAAPALDNEHNFVLDFVRQLASGRYERRELMRVAYKHRDYLEKAAKKLNFALGGYAISVVFNATVIWANFHGARILDWEPVSARLLGEAVSDNTIWFSDKRSNDLQESDQKKRLRINLGTRHKLFGD